MTTTPTAAPQTLEEQVRALQSQGVDGATIAITLGFTRKSRVSDDLVPDVAGLNRALNEERGIMLVTPRQGQSRDTGIHRVNRQHQLVLGKIELAKIGALPGSAFKCELDNGVLVLVPSPENDKALPPKRKRIKKDDATQAPVDAKPAIEVDEDDDLDPDLDDEGNNYI